MVPLAILTFIFGKYLTTHSTWNVNRNVQTGMSISVLENHIFFTLKYFSSLAHILTFSDCFSSLFFVYALVQNFTLCSVIPGVE